MTQPTPCSCIICKKLTSNLGIAGHIRMAHSETEEVKQQLINFKQRGKEARQNIIPWNKGLVGDIRCKISEETKEKIRNVPGVGKAKTEEGEVLRKQRISEKAKLNNGGYRQGSGRGKQGWYKGYWCDSSWELAFLVYHLDNNISIERCQEKRSYEFEGKIKTYLPDFKIGDIIYEIKGFKTMQWEAKHNANPDIKCLFLEQMKPYLNYAEEKYGRDFISIYE